VRAREVRWDRSGTEPGGGLYIVLGNENTFYVQVFVCKRILSAIGRVECEGDRVECEGDRMSPIRTLIT
jgi:hypothetical protein